MSHDPDHTRPPLYSAKRRLRRVVATPLFFSLRALALVYDSDKRSGHDYLPYYRRHLNHRRFTVRRIIEIGVGGYSDRFAGGNSLRMWRTFFPLATVVGIDLHPKVINEPRVTIIRGSQSDSAVLDRALEICGGSVDLVIDDGSHINEDVRISFQSLFPQVSPGGLYVIEDLQTSYSCECGGGPPGAEGTSVAMVKSLVDTLNLPYISQDASALFMREALVGEAHVYPNIAFLERAK